MIVGKNTVGNFETIIIVNDETILKDYKYKSPFRFTEEIVDCFEWLRVAVVDGELIQERIISPISEKELFIGSLDEIIKYGELKNLDERIY
jgi:hypothetical protein